ncbi:arabinofuranosidase catalytic domain-containing protein [Bosea sp. 117]|uniref:arabinofuranosidase catalytic domain-containing protein n=1 Tax=Bosea sp. 117 TaxID=1125973 RepID=UPI00068DAC68|nr:arabinofuranosidase catalytic domain-containing protein [Bosea sp. 117]
MAVCLRLDLARRRATPTPRPLDLVPAAQAFGLCRLGSVYSGPLLRARRASDGAETDIGIGADGWLDADALLAFAAGAAAYVAVWYDQSGNGRHAVQTSAAAQPQIAGGGAVAAIGGRPALNLATGQYFTSTAPALAQPCGLLAVVQLPDYTRTSDQHLVRADAGTGATAYFGSARNWTAFAGSAVTHDVAVADGAACVVDAAFNGAASRVGINGAGFAGNAGTVGIGANPNILRGGALGTAVVGLVGEFILFTRDLTAAEASRIGAALGAPRGIAVS